MEHTSPLLSLLIAFSAAKVLAEIFERLRMPSVVGELVAGVLIGPSLLGWIHLSGAEGELLLLLSEIGVIVLLFQVGLETEPSELRKVGAQAGAVGVLGVVIPFGFGYLVSIAAGYEPVQAAFVATALTATSVGITARVLGDVGALTTKPARIILGAAIIDDILGLLVLAVVSGMAVGSTSVGNLVTLGIEAILFVGVLLLLGPPAMNKISHWLELPKLDRAPFAISLIVLLGLSVLAEQISLAAIIGAFLAGTIFSGTKDRYSLEHQIEPVADLLTPFFFVVTGAQLDLKVLGDPSIAAFAGVITVVAVVGKMAAGMIGGRSLGAKKALAVGVGMVPRGEVGIVVAGLALREGIVDRDLFSAVLLMVAATTLVAPPFLQKLMARAS